MADQIFNVKSGFFNSINNDRLYNADDMNKPYKRLVTDGVFATQSGTPSTDLQVLSANDGMNIIVKKGNGIFNSKWFENPNDITILVPSNTALQPRRDSVIVQIDTRSSGRKGSIVYREGTPSANPMPPAIGTVDGVIEYRIANVYVGINTVYIGQDGIVDLRGSSECPWVTGLIKQVDTSELFRQWQAAYQKYYDDVYAEWREFMEELSGDLTVNTNIVTYESQFVTTLDGTTVIPINISAFNKYKDVLMVRVNRLFVSEGTDYTISADGTKITLTKDLQANQTVDFLVLQSVIVGDIETVLIELQRLASEITAINNKLVDGGWINFTLESGATAYDTNNKPAVRKYGNRINIRGAIKGVTSTGTTICTLPSAYKPAMDHIYTTTAINGANITATVTIQILASSGQVKLLAKSGTIGATDMISIATNFIVG